ncbi:MULTISPECIES: SCO4848 family membrane protein [unclassified Microcella]|uniref:SCO4848 family membrane protein n=1 Tax=unclassified Microcella TaxID=2630066 RepID=UPI0006FBCE2A|nr:MULTISPECIES: hypothetical protein [unclassified Microcella]KQV26280.1 hypothetical protein ASC54_05100 [Yonghaparkia sp. Root332]KRF32937.1 hypothetical protein ASG83_02645 [Yonghaparkia sp. Soil809]
MDAPSIAAVVVLLLGALFNAVAWPRFYPRIASDPRSRNAAGRRTAFFRVHVVLIALALVIAVLSVIAAVLLLAG